MELTKKDLAYFNMAKEVSTMSNFPRVHMGCVVTDGHRVISSGFNSTKTNPLQKQLNKIRFSEDTNHSLHAEVSALLPLLNRTDINWKKCSIYVYRELKNGQRAMACPCASCRKLIRQLGIKKVYYTGDNSYIFENFS